MASPTKITSSGFRQCASSISRTITFFFLGAPISLPGAFRLLQNIGIKHNQLHKVLYSFYLLCLLKWEQAASQKPNTSSRLQASYNSLSSFAKQKLTNCELPGL